MPRTPGFLVVLVLSLVALLLPFFAACGSGGNVGDVVRPGSAGWLAVVREGSLILVNPDSGEPSDLAPLPVEAPAGWAESGLLLAAMSGDELWVGRPEGPLAPVARVDGGVASSAPAWAPGALRVAFSVAGGTPGVYLFNRTPAELRQLYPVDSETAGWWSPAGVPSPLLVVRELATGKVVLIDPDALTERTLFEAKQVAVRPGDERLLYIDEAGALQVWSPFEETRALVPNAGAVEDVRWLPDGRGFTFATAASGGASGAGEIWLATFDGAEPVRVGSGLVHDWSADGRQLAAANGGTIAIIDRTTGEAQAEIAGSEPRWQPSARPGGIVGNPGDHPESRNVLGVTTSFEDGLDGWIDTGLAPPTTERTTEDSVVGDAAAHVSFDGAESAFMAVLTARKAQLDGQQLSFSAWVKTSDPGVQLSHISSSVRIEAGSGRSEAHPGDGEWHRLSVSFTPRYDVEGTTAFIVFGVVQSGTGQALIDGAQLEFSAAPTDYSPPLDDPLSGLPRGEPITLAP